MSEHALAQQQMTNTPQEAARDSLSLQHRYGNRAESTVLHERFFDEACRTFAEPRFGYDFSRVPAHTDMMRRAQPLLRTVTMVQRYSVNGNADSATCATCSDEESAPVSTTSEPTTEPASPAPEATATTEPEEESAAPEETTAPALLVEDSAAELAPGQMRKGEFLAQLRAAVTSTAESAMAGTGRTTADCPYLDYWFDYYSAQDVQHVERALRRYAPEASSATSAGEYIPIVAARVRRSVETWVRTGEVTGVPEGVSTSLPGETSSGSGGSAPAVGGPVMAKARDGGVKSTDNPKAIQAELGQGHSLDSGVRSRMESAFGMDFSQVRTHTDTTAAGLSNRLNARAFTVGEHVAFGAGEYKPGTLVGDALIAHEMAHVVQQSGASDSVAPMQTRDMGYNTLENDADKSAIGAIASLWTGTKDDLSDIAKNAVPRFRSGLRLSRCESRSGKNLKVNIRPVKIANDDGKSPTTLPSFVESKDIWKKCCIDISENAAKTVSETDYKILDDPGVGSTPSAEEKKLFKDAGVGGGAISIFVPQTFKQGARVSKDISGGGVAYDAGKSDAKVVVVEGIDPTLVAHELGHAMGYLPHKSGTVMEATGAHNKATKKKVTADICDNVRKFTGAKVETKECKISTK